MTELELYKFIKDNLIEVDWRGDSLIIWIDAIYLQEFTDLMGYSFFDDGGHEVSLLADGIIAFDLVDICDYCGIEPENILKKEEE